MAVPVRFALLVIWIAVIFFLGSGQGSMAETSRFIRPLLEFLFPAASEELLTVYHGLIRKLAHIAEYAVLAVLAYRAFSAATTWFLRSQLWLAAILLVAATAVADEFIQSFIESRTSSPRDVAIDLAGGAAAVAACHIVGRFAARRSAPTAS